MPLDASSLNLAVISFVLLIAAAHIAACYAVGRFWRDQRNRSFWTGFVVSLILTPIVGWILGVVGASVREVLTDAEVTSLREELQETYREVDKKLHSHP